MNKLFITVDSKEHLVGLEPIPGHEGFVQAVDYKAPKGLSQDEWDFLVEVALYGVNEGDKGRTVFREDGDTYPTFSWRVE